MNFSIKADQNFIAIHSKVVDQRIGQPFTKNKIQFYNKTFQVYISINWSTLHSESIKILIQAIVRLEVSKLVKLWVWLPSNPTISQIDVADHQISQAFN